MKRTSNEISDLILNNQINLYNKIYRTIENDFSNIPDSKLGLLIEVMMDLENKILYIHKNYSKIVKNISKNILPTKKKFIDDLNKIITYN